MNGQYSFSDLQSPPHTHAEGTVVAIDSGSPLVSVAISVDGDRLAERVTEQGGSSASLLLMIDEVLAEATVPLSAVDLLVALRGPGSFTGLRIGLATVLGTKMALQIAAGTLPTLQVLATLAPPDATRVKACVNALRGEWMTQEFATTPPYSPLAPPRIETVERLSRNTSIPLVGYGISKVASRAVPGEQPIAIEPGPLAAQTLRILPSCPADMNPANLVNPLYLQAPAVSRPGPGPG